MLTGQFPEEKVKRLPQWARSLIFALRQDAANLQKMLKCGEPTNTYETRLMESRPIDPMSGIRFGLRAANAPDHHHFNVDCHVSVESGVYFLDVNAGAGLVVEPRAANSIRIRLSR